MCTILLSLAIAITKQGFIFIYNPIFSGRWGSFPRGENWEASNWLQWRTFQNQTIWNIGLVEVVVSFTNYPPAHLPWLWVITRHPLVWFYPSWKQNWTKLQILICQRSLEWSSGRINCWIDLRRHFRYLHIHAKSEVTLGCSHI